MGFNLLALDDLFGVFFICVMSFADLYIILLVLQMYSVHSTVQHDLATIIGYEPSPAAMDTWHAIQKYE